MEEKLAWALLSGRPVTKARARSGMTFQLRILSGRDQSQPSGPVPWIKYHPQWLCERLSDGRRARPPGRQIPNIRQRTARRSSYQGSGSSKRLAHSRMLHLRLPRNRQGLLLQPGQDWSEVNYGTKAARGQASEPAMILPGPGVSRGGSLCELSNGLGAASEAYECSITMRRST